jgi:streptogramin lyase
METNENRNPQTIEGPQQNPEDVSRMVAEAGAAQTELANQAAAAADAAQTPKYEGSMATELKAAEQAAVEAARQGVEAATAVEPTAGEEKTVTPPAPQAPVA